MALYDGHKNMAQRPQQPIISSLLIAGLALLLVATHLAPDMRSPSLFLFKAGLQPITALILLASLLFCLWSRRKMTVISVVFACLINIPFLMPTLAQKTNFNVPTNAQPLSVATFSTLTRTQNTSDIVKFIKSEQPDLLCLQEVSQIDRALLLNKLAGYYQHHIESNNNQLTLSHYPLKLVDGSGYSQANVLNHPEWGDIHVINVHMPKPYLSNQLASDWKKLFKLIDLNAKTVLCGDFNITPNNSLYDVLNYDYGFIDSLDSGYGFTFPNSQRKLSLLGPFIRIDYIFTKQLHARNTRTVTASNLSDHRAVITELTLNQ